MPVTVKMLQTRISWYYQHFDVFYFNFTSFVSPYMGLFLIVFFYFQPLFLFFCSAFRMFWYKEEPISFNIQLMQIIIVHLQSIFTLCSLCKVFFKSDFILHCHFLIELRLSRQIIHFIYEVLNIRLQVHILKAMISGDDLHQVGPKYGSLL